MRNIRDPDIDELNLLEEEIALIRSRIQTLHAQAGERAPKLKDLREDIHEIKSEIQLRKQESNPENFFTRCCGVIVDQGNANTVSIRFTPLHLGHKWEVYNLILRRNSEKQWIFSYCDLPYSIKFIPDTIFKARIFSKVDLCNFIRKIQRQVQAHVVRRQQIVATEDLIKGQNVKLYPSINTLHTTIEMTVSDVDLGNDVYIVNLYLKYKPDSILPEEMSFKFDGGSEESHSYFKTTMSVLKELPLPDAMQQIFFPHNEESVSELSDVEQGNVASKKKVVAKTSHKIRSEDSDNSAKSMSSASTLPVFPKLVPPPIAPLSDGNIHQGKQLNNSDNDISVGKPKKRTRRPKPRQNKKAV